MISKFIANVICENDDVIKDATNDSGDEFEVLTGVTLGVTHQ